MIKWVRGLPRSRNKEEWCELWGLAFQGALGKAGVILFQAGTWLGRSGWPSGSQLGLRLINPTTHVAVSYPEGITVATRD